MFSIKATQTWLRKKKTFFVGSLYCLCSVLVEQEGRRVQRGGGGHENSESMKRWEAVKAQDGVGGEYWA